MSYSKTINKKHLEQQEKAEFLDKPLEGRRRKMSYINKKRTRIMIMVYALMIALVSALTFYPEKGAFSATPAPQGKPIVLGATLPLTGMYAETAKWIERAYRYWAEEVNDKGGLLGRPVKLIIYDDESSVEKAVNYLERAINVDKVDLLLGGYPTPTIGAQMAVAEKYRMLYNSMGGQLRPFEQGFTYCTSVPTVIGEWLMNGFIDIMQNLPTEIRPKTAAVMNMKTGTGESIHTGMEERIKKSGIQILMDEWYTLPLASADSLVAKAAGTNADIFIVNGFFPEGVLAVRAMKALNYNPKAVYQSIGSTVPAWSKELGADGDYVFSGGTRVNPSLPFPAIKRLGKVVQERFQIDPKLALYFYLGYGWCEAIQQAVEGTKSLKQDTLRDYMFTHEITLFGDLKIRLDKRGLPPPYRTTFQLQKGVIEVVYPPEFATAKPIYPKPPFRK